MCLAIPPHPLQSQKRENTLSRFWQMPPRREGGRWKWGRGLFFHKFPTFSRVSSPRFRSKREEEETKEHLVRKSGKASVVVVGEEKKEKCAYGWGENPRRVAKREGGNKKIALSSKTLSLLSRRRGKQKRIVFLLLYAGNIEGSAANFLGREGEDEKGGEGKYQGGSARSQKKWDTAKNTAQG